MQHFCNITQGVYFSIIFNLLSQKMYHNNYENLIRNNREWAQDLSSKNPGFFPKLSAGQSPPFLFIGCSDSRSPLDTILKTQPGELCIHRNVANQISVTDMNLLVVLEYAIDVLKVSHVIVCGHYRCGGVQAAYDGTALGIVENWVAPIQDLYIQNKIELDSISDIEKRVDTLSELNVKKQVENLKKTFVYRRAFSKGYAPSLHGWVLDLKTGLIKELS